MSYSICKDLCILSSISPCFFFNMFCFCSVLFCFVFLFCFVLFFVFVLSIYAPLVSSFSCMMIQESSVAHSFVGLLLFTVARAILCECFNLIFFIKGRFRPLVTISEVSISEKAHISFSLARLSLCAVSSCTR